MSAAEISKEVLDFLAQHIDSVMQLEMLLFLQSGDATTFTARQIAEDLRIDSEWTQKCLLKMTEAGILTFSETGFGYAPALPQTAQTIADLAHAYASHRVRIIGMIFSKPADPIRQFTDAFRFKKDTER